MVIGRGRIVPRDVGGPAIALGLVALLGASIKVGGSGHCDRPSAFVSARPIREGERRSATAVGRWGVGVSGVRLELPLEHHWNQHGVLVLAPARLRSGGASSLPLGGSSGSSARPAQWQTPPDVKFSGRRDRANKPSRRWRLASDWSLGWLLDQAATSAAFKNHLPRLGTQLESRGMHPVRKAVGVFGPKYRYRATRARAPHGPALFMPWSDAPGLSAHTLVVRSVGQEDGSPQWGVVHEHTRRPTPGATEPRFEGGGAAEDTGLAKENVGGSTRAMKHKNDARSLVMMSYDKIEPMIWERF